MINDIKVCVNDIQGGEISGKIYYCYAQDPVPFQSMAEMVLTLDGIFDDLEAPAAEPPRKTLKPVVPKEKEALRYCHDFKDFEISSGEKFSFFIKIRYRRNVSWQGSVHFSGDKCIYQFRSVLELMGYLTEKVGEHRNGGEKQCRKMC